MSSSQFRRPKVELRVGGKYRLGRKLGSGSFGDLYLGTYTDGIERRRLIGRSYDAGTHIHSGEEFGVKLVGPIYDVNAPSLTADICRRT